MIVTERLLSSLEQRRLSQAELARRVGVSQKTINKLARGESYGTKHLHQIARELGTTPAYLTGEIDDPDEGAPPPDPAPTIQLVQMQVAFPPQPALEAMFRGLLRSMPDLSGDELAHELSMLLPTGLAQLRQPYRFEPLVNDDAPIALDEEPPVARRARSRGSRR